MKVTSLFASNKTLSFPNRKRIELDFPIRDVCLIDNVLVVVLSIDPKVILNNNVFAYTIEGDFLWQINIVKDIHYFGQDQCPFTGSYVSDIDELTLFNWCSMALRVNHRTGEILERSAGQWI